MRFRDKTAVVAGGGSGIGQATAFALAAEGCRVVIADINEKTATETCEKIIVAGGKCRTVIGNASIIDTAERIAKEAVDHFGGIHYLCNSAGLQTYGTVETTDEATWDLTMDVNLKSIYLVSKYCIPEIRKQGGGAVVNISSVQGLRCQSNVSAYAASKGAVIAMTRSMALDYARENIRVNCICPGSIDTPLLRFGAAQHGELDEVLKEWGQSHPIGRIGTAAEIAQVVLFLFSDAAGFIVGQPLVADGGLMSKIL